MVVYNFKKIAVVPTAKDFVDIVLSKTQRKTPTEVHKQYKISRIRGFYMRKVKITAVNFAEKLTQILTEFPKLDDIHPFYSDLMNVLYDKDHYKLALGQLSNAKHLIESLAKEYVRLLKYGDSLYRCKMLKRAALGRMVTLILGRKQSLIYLEEVRQHLGRLPSIDPHTRTILVTGYPNVGKSSFINKVTRADVEVQPYAFTTKSLFIGHTDHRYLRFQLIDTPGILDHPLEERNTIEMQAITALAHLRAAILYFIDPSEQCGYTLEHQKALFDSLQPLFSDKPLFVVANKSDVWQDAITDDQRELVDAFRKEATVLEMSNKEDDASVMNVKLTVCDALLQHRVEQKFMKGKGESVTDRLRIAVPKGVDVSDRPPCIPESVLLKRRRVAVAEHAAPTDGEDAETWHAPIDSEDDENISASKQVIPAHVTADHLRHDVFDKYCRRKGLKPRPRRSDGLPTERQIMDEAGDDYSFDINKFFDLVNPDEKYDVVPEVWNGHNLADFIDPDIVAKMEKLEAEEERLLEAERLAAEEIEMERDPDQVAEAAKVHELAVQIRDRKILMKRKQQLDRNNNGPPPMSRVSRAAKARRPITALQSSLQALGVDTDKAVERMRSVERMANAAKRRRFASTSMDDDEMGMKSATTQSRSRTPSAVRTPRSESGITCVATKAKVKRLAKRAQNVKFGRHGKAGESDRAIKTKMPKHLFSGKRGLGKTERR